MANQITKGRDTARKTKRSKPHKKKEREAIFTVRSTLQAPPFGTLPPNPALIGYALEGALLHSEYRFPAPFLQILP